MTRKVNSDLITLTHRSSDPVVEIEPVVSMAGCMVGRYPLEDGCSKSIHVFSGGVLMPAITPKVLSSAEFAQVVGTGVNRIRAYVRTGKIRAVRYGRRIVIPLSEVDKFLSNEATARVQA
jgi:excisionase family DNA binding protein